MADPLLNTELKRRVQDVYAEFVSDVNPTRLSDWLIQEKVITIDQWQEIKASEKTNPDICRRLLNHLFHLSNPKTFLVVREALVKQNHWLLQKIDQHHCTCKQTEMFAELEKSNKALQSQVMELKDKLVKYAELEKSNQQLLSQVMEHKDKLVKYAELEKSNKQLLSQVMEHKDELEKYAELEQNNQTLKSQIMELRDELDKAITAKNDLEEERRIWIVRERDLTNTMNSTKAEFVRLNIDWVVKEHKYIKEIAHLRDNVATNKNELLLTRRVSPSSADQNVELAQIKETKITSVNPFTPGRMQRAGGAKQETDSKDRVQVSYDGLFSYNAKYSRPTVYEEALDFHVDDDGDDYENSLIGFDDCCLDDGYNGYED